MRYTVQELMNIFEANHHHEVVESIDQHVFSALENPLITRIVAASYFKLGDYPNSVALLSQIESCFVEDIEYLSLYGACLRRNGDLDLARVQFERALKLDSDLPSVQNNYANLLIDIGNFAQAEDILKRLLADDPSYSDALINLQRLVEKQQIAEDSSLGLNSASNWTMADPLLMAFSEDEVQRTYLSKSSSKTSLKFKSTLANSLPEIKEYQLAADQLKLAQQAIIDKRYDFALKLCSQAYVSLPESSAIYECVSDAYIAQSLFKEAEICLLHALQMGVSTFKIFVNLVSLSCMRGDSILAQLYFERALSVDSENSALPPLRAQVSKCKKNNSSAPFRFDHKWSTP